MFFLTLDIAEAEAPKYEPVYPVDLPEYKHYAYDVIRDTWGEEQWESFNTIVEKESSWVSTAQNPHSTAFGYMQFLNMTWSGVGCEKTIDPDTQIDCGVRYIQNRYSTPDDALSFHVEHNWY